MMLGKNKKSMMAWEGAKQWHNFFEELNKFVLQKPFTGIRDSKEWVAKTQDVSWYFCN